MVLIFYTIVMGAISIEKPFRSIALVGILIPCLPFLMKNFAIIMFYSILNTNFIVV